MGGGKRPGGSKAALKAAAKSSQQIVGDRQIWACNGCKKDEGHTDLCQIRKVNYAVYNKKCPREQELQPKPKAKGKRKRRKRK